ncbi:ribonuclease H-like domain-containing protein [Gongronella butleri]|nr:ribonuclease H-like domain-containing protein [Gongronella butleri]
MFKCNGQVSEKKGPSRLRSSTRKPLTRPFYRQSSVQVIPRAKVLEYKAAKAKAQAKAVQQQQQQPQKKVTLKQWQPVNALVPPWDADTLLNDYIESLPLIRLPSHYRVVCTRDPNVVNDLIPRMIREGSVFGLDLEWQPTFKAQQQQNKTALFQLCSPSMVLLVQVYYMKELPRELTLFLKNDAYIKTGVHVSGDGYKLRTDFGVTTRGLLDTRRIARVVSCPSLARVPKHRSLRNLTGILLGEHLPKSDVRMSNWGTTNLSRSQIDYATFDAYASYALFHELNDIAQEQGVTLPLKKMVVSIEAPTTIEK